MNFVLIILIMLIILYYLKYKTNIQKFNNYKLKTLNSVYRINNKPCTQNTKRCYYPYSTNKNIKSYLCCKNHLIELLSYIVKVFNENKIIYFLDYGTLLGCLRNNSFIPWDTDIDIGVIKNKKLNKIMNIISKNDKNYNLVKKTDVFYRLNFSKKNTLHVDIMINKNNKNNYYYDKSANKFKYNCMIHENDLFPLKESTFENIVVKIPKNSKKYLENNVYGKGCISNPKTRGKNKPWGKWY
jgi:phosphorylcholine metabolism protein LicD